MNSVLSVIAVLLCFNCALTICIMAQMLNFRDVLVILVNLLSEEDEDE